jgi:hypothetical protein
MSFFKQKTAEEHLQELAMSVTKKVKEKILDGDFDQELQIMADKTKASLMCEILKEDTSDACSYLVYEIGSVIKDHEWNRLHLISCISVFMAYIEQHGVFPKPLRNMSSCEVFLGVYYACINADQEFYSKVER